MNENYNNISNNFSEAIDWNDTIVADGQTYVILDEGDYNFKVRSFERGRFPGSPKIPPCNKATLTLEVECDGGLVTVKHDLILCRSLEWKLSAFFRAIGQKKAGERLVMDWNKVVGAQGRARFKPRTYTNRNGEERQTNDLDRFYDYDPANFPVKEVPDWVREADNAPVQNWEQTKF